MKNKVTIVVPTYKRAAMICTSLESILAQTYSNYEVIIVDDNAENKEDRKATKIAVEPYLKNKNFKYIERKTNGGGGATRNTGLDLATGEYITFLDDDDEFYADYLEKQYNNIKKNKTDISVCGSITFDENGNKVTEKSYLDYKPGQNLMAYHITNMIVGTQTFLFKTSAIKAVGGFEAVPAGQDFVLIYNLLEQGCTVSFVNEPLTKINVHSQERITVGNKKLVGEKKLYELKKKYFNLVTNKDKRKIRFRYYSIMFSTNYKMKKYSHVLANLVLAFFTRPLYFMKKALGG